MHDHDHSTKPGSTRLRILLAAVLGPVGLLVAVLALVVHGDGTKVSFPDGLGPQSHVVRATIVTRTVSDCPGSVDPTTGLPLPQVAEPKTAQSTECLHLRLRLTEGKDKGKVIALDTQSTAVQPIPTSGGILLAYDPHSANPDYSFSDVQRGRPVLVIFLVFAVALALVARWTGIRALLGLGASLAVLLVFVLPALEAGHSALLVSLVGSAIVLYLVQYLAYGFTVQTSIALLGTLLSLLLCGGLAQLFVNVASLTGLGSDEADVLVSTVTLNLKGLLLAGVVIGALGALLDMTVTQASAVWALHETDPELSTLPLYRSAMRIGRDHIGAATTTLVLAYAGAALPLLVLYQLAHVSFGTAITSETVASEVVRTLVGTIGLVAAVPLTTMLAALAVRADLPRAPRVRTPKVVRGGASWS